MVRGLAGGAVFGPVEVAAWAAIALASLWIAVRLSFVGPMSVDARGYRLALAFRRTGGRFWRLAAAYILSWLLAGGIIAAVLFLMDLLDVPATDVGSIMAILILSSAFGPIAAITAAPAAAALRDSEARPDISETFA
jgi:hypothetical protein